MTDKLRVTLCQYDIHWNNPAANRSFLEEKLAELENTDLVILPEMFTTGFTMDAQDVAEIENGTTLKWLKQVASRNDFAIAGSFVVKENGSFYNRLVWVDPSGKTYTYNKRHLFRMANEHLTYSAGTEKLIISYKGWNICPQVCYDLRFPVWARNQNNEYDLLFYVANWPAVRSKPWNILLQARAIENLSYCIGVNRIGKDHNGIFYSGSSQVVSPKGEVLFEQVETECFQTIVLEKASLVEFRNSFPAHLDADQFNLLK